MCFCVKRLNYVLNQPLWLIAIKTFSHISVICAVLQLSAAYMENVLFVLMDHSGPSGCCGWLQQSTGCKRLYIVNSTVCWDIPKTSWTNPCANSLFSSTGLWIHLLRPSLFSVNLQSSPLTFMLMNKSQRTR